MIHDVEWVPIMDGQLVCSVAGGHTESHLDWISKRRSGFIESLVLRQLI